MILHRFLFLLALAGSAAAPALAADPTPDVVAKVGTADIPASALQDFVRTLDPVVRRQALADPATMDRLLRAELTRMAVLKEAEAQKWDKRPEVVREIQRVRDEAVTASFLKSVATPPAGYPSEADIKAAYDLNRDALMAPRQYRLSQIFVAIPAGGDAKAEAAARQQAEDLTAKARAKGADFDALAKAASGGKPGEQGGDLGWAAETDIVPEIRAQIAGMAQGEISDPIRVRSGWHIVRLDETRPAGPRALAEVHDALATALRQRKAEADQQAYLSGLLAKTPIAVNATGIKKIFENLQ